MLHAALWLSVLACPQVEEVVAPANLSWLARHQAEDGSWGRYVENCTCPGLGAPPKADIKRDPAVEAKLKPLLEKLASDEPSEREAALEAIVAFGEPAEPFLADVFSTDVEVKGRVADALRRLARARTAPEVSTTSLALLAFLGAGYSHLSKDTVKGICFGDVVRRAIKYLMKQQDAAGRIGSDRDAGGRLVHLHAALALSEAYGLTGSNLFKGPAQLAVDAAVAMQVKGSGWSPGGDAPVDTITTAWGATLLKSAELSGLTFPSTAYDGVRAWFASVFDDSGRAGLFKKGDWDAAKRKHDTATAAALLSLIFIDKNKSDPRLAKAAAILTADVPAEKDFDAEYTHFGSLALFQFDGPSGSGWKAWNDRMKQTVLGLQEIRKADCNRGSWPAAAGGSRTLSTALNALTLEVYYRYANVFGTK